MRYTFGMRSTVVGTSARAMMSLFGIAGVGGRLREVGVFNTTTTAVAIALARFTNATGVGAGQAEGEYDENAAAPSCTVFAGHTADGGVGQILRQATLGAAAGAGVIWTFGDSGIVIQPGTANGLGILTPTGTGQLCDLYFDWDE
ncbi:MAG: hypothetical protein A2W35_17950 [Chloroflexi bacterium RBG_16_57_11]|nr:MAG: hypothetical protein A2W35_17950 [Chloroflexi bacterium RBG_16_57_11]